MRICPACVRAVLIDMELCAGVDCLGALPVPRSHEKAPVLPCIVLLTAERGAAAVVGTAQRRQLCELYVGGSRPRAQSPVA